MSSKKRRYSRFPACSSASFLIVFLLFFCSCRKEIKSPQWDADVLLPLVKSMLTINNLIPDSLLQQNPDNSLDIVYNTSLYSFNMDTLFKVPDTSLNNKYISPIAATVPPGGTIVPVTNEKIKYQLGDVQLTRIIIRSGSMGLLIKSSIQEKTNLIYQVPGLKDPSGNDFSITAVVPAGTPAANGIYNEWFDLSGYTVDLTGTGGAEVNTIVIIYSAIVDPGGNTAQINPGDSVVINNTFMDIIPQYAKGYFGNSVSAIGPDTSAFSLFKNIIDGTLQLEDIDINFTIENSVGADARIVFSNITSINSRTGNTVPLSHSVINSPININRSLDVNGNVTPSVYQVAITPANSNIKPFIENFPSQLSYQLQFEINPLGNVSGNNDFIYYDKLLKTNFNVRIPLSLVANNLTLADTFNLELGENSENVNSATLWLHCYNGFPFSAEAQLYIMDGNYKILDSLISFPGLIAAPNLDANFIAAGKRFTRLTIPVSKDKMETLRSAPKLFVKMKFNTAMQPNYVKIYSFYEMNVQLTGQFNYTAGK